MLVAFIQNAAVLITLSVFYGVIKWYRIGNKSYYHLMQGLLFGIIAIAAMMIPYKYDTGMIYDGRSVILTLVGFWGGGYSAVFSVIIAGLYRAYIGGAGIWAGISTILFCSLTGFFFRQLLKQKLNELTIYHFWLIGIVSHLVMLASQLLLPVGSIHVIASIAIPILLVFPLTFTFISKLIQLIERYIAGEHKIRAAETLYRTTLMSIGDAVICTDQKGFINQMNAVAEELTGWKFNEANKKPLEQIFKIINENSREVIESPFTKVISSGSIVGLANHTLLVSKDGKEIPIADSGAPIKGESGEIIGVVLVFRDQTEERDSLKKIANSEAKYREREFWLRESQKAGRIGSYDFDILNNHWTTSDTLNEIFGISNDNPRTLESWSAIIHPDQQKEMLDYFLNSVVKNRKPFDKEYKIIRQNDGAERWVLGRGELSFDENKNPVRMLGTIMDITERKLYEQQLRESEERFRKSILLSPIPIMVHDEEGKVINISEGWTHFSGYKHEDIPTLKAWTEKAYGEKAEEVEKYVTSLFNEKETILSGEFEITSKLGEKRIWNFYTTPLGKFINGKKIMLSMAPDVTQRVMVKAELEESERAYRQLFENHTAVKLIIDPDNGAIVKANKAAEDYYGWSVEEIQTMKINQINILSDEEIKKALEHARANQRVYFEFKHQLANEQVRDVEVFASKIEQKGKDLLHSIVHDVTEKKKLFNDLIIAKEKAEESDRLKTAFLANMSHEIRTPMNAIMGFSSLLPEENDEGKIAWYSGIIVKNSEYLVHLIDDVILYSKLQTNLLKYNPAKFDIGELTDDIIQVFKLQQQEKGIPLKAEVKIDLPFTINTDYEKLKQLLTNLISNAFKYTENGEIVFGVKLAEDKILFWVKDTGIGIPEEDVDKVFERFYRAGNTQNGSVGGTGLGLSIVKELASLLGGIIWFESKQGEGTAFYFSLATNLI